MKKLFGILCLVYSLESFAWKQKFTFDFVPKVQTSEGSFGSAYGASGSLLARPIKHLETGLALRYMGLQVHREPHLFALAYELSVPVRGYWEVFENFEIQGFVDLGAQLLFGGGQVVVGPSLETGAGLLYTPSWMKGLGLNLDLLYHVAWVKLQTAYVRHEDKAGGLLEFQTYPVAFSSFRYFALKLGLSYNY